MEVEGKGIEGEAAKVCKKEEENLFWIQKELCMLQVLKIYKRLP
jgi:hypothetical protein